MAVRNPPAWLQSGSHPAEHDRLLLGSLVPAEGVVGLGDLAVTPNGTPNMTVNVAAGAAFVRNDLAANGGVYHSYNDATLNLAITPAHATLPRKDLVVLRIRDATYAGGSNDAALVVLAGTPASSPAEAAIPLDGSYLALALVDVPAAATQIAGGQVTDRRPRAAVPANNALPVGATVDYAGGVAPAGWLVCDGSAVSRTAYAALYAAIGTAWGPGDGSTTFNLPDSRGRVAVGAGQGPSLTARQVGQLLGAETHQLALAEVPGHSHVVNSHSHGGVTGWRGISHAHGLGGHVHWVNGVGDHRHMDDLGFNYAWRAGGTQNDRLGTWGQVGGAGITYTDHRNAGGHDHGNTQGPSSGSDWSDPAHDHGIGAESPGTSSQGGGGAHNNLQPSAVFTKLIKAF